MKIQEDVLISELENLLHKKIDLLKCVNTVYSNSIDLVESKNYTELLQKLDQQKMTLEQIDEVDSTINNILKTNNISQKELLNSSKNNSEIPYNLSTVVTLIKESKKLLKSTRTLNEKLSYKVNDAWTEIKRNMSEAKNRRLIHSGYGKRGQQKTGLLFDYIETGDRKVFR